MIYMKNIYVKRFLNVLLFFFFLLGFSIDYVFADPQIIIDAGGGDSASTAAPRAGNWDTSFQGFGGYRVTLVDKNGKRVSGTRSVDFYNPGNGNNISTYRLVYGDKYLYRTSERSSVQDANYVSKDGLVRYGSSYIPFGKWQSTGLFADVEADENFREQYIKNYENNKVFCLNGEECNDKLDFLSLFLHLSNYLSSSDNLFYNNTQKTIELLDYSIFIEHLYKIGGVNVYGTGFEMYYDSGDPLTEKIRNQQALENFRFVCSSYSRSGPSELFENYPSDYHECLENGMAYNGKIYIGNAGNWADLPGITLSTTAHGDVWDVYKGNVQKFKDVQDKIAVGVTTVMMKDVVERPPFESEMNLCNNGIVSFKSNSNTKSNVEEGDEVFKKELFKTNNKVDDSQALYCYDIATYNYSDTIESLGGIKALNTNIEPKPITATITRRCYNVNGSEKLADQISKDYNESIYIRNLYGNDYEFSSSKCSDIKTVSHNGVSVVSCKINYSLSNSITLSRFSINRNLLNKENTAYIDFSNYKERFGASNKLINEILNNGISLPSINFFREDKFIEIDEYKYRLTSPSLSGDSGKCSFNYTIEADESMLSSNSNFKFRVISLDNPFPARDGTFRMPGLNWLSSTDNNVFEYITNNRGIRYVTKSNDVSPEEMYNKVEPMYTVTLTPSTMIKIRNYNKKYAYDSMYQSMSADVTSHGAYKLECNYHDLGNGDIGNGRECYSTFLRKYINDSMGGVCYLSPSELNKDVTGYKKDLSPLLYILNSSSTSYSIDYDLNKNNRNDALDWYILQPENRGKNIQYYTCANKTFLSGGPIEGGR